MLAVIFRIFLNCIVRQMNVDLIKLLVWKIIYIGWRSHVSLLEKVKTLVMRNQWPNSYVKLTTLEQQRCLDIFLNNERVIGDLFHFLSILLSSCFPRSTFCISLCLIHCFQCFLTNVYQILIFATSDKIFRLLLYFGLKHIDPVMSPQNLLQVFKRIEHMDPNTSVQACWFKQPEILMLMFWRPNRVSCPYNSIMLLLYALQFFIQLLVTELIVFLKKM